MSRYPYDPTKPDPLGIHAEVERERLESRFRDGCSRSKIHPVDNDIGRLIDFVAARRLRQPGVMKLLWRVLHRVDTEAIRLLVDIVLTKGSYGQAMQSRCQRLLDYCVIIDAALALKPLLPPTPAELEAKRLAIIKEADERNEAIVKFAAAYVEGRLMDQPKGVF